MRKAEVTRNTTETKIHLQLTIDGTGQQSIKTGVGFLDHMLELFVRHGRRVGDTERKNRAAV